MYQSVPILTAARVVEIAARYLRLTHSPPFVRASASQIARIGSHGTSRKMPVEAEAKVMRTSAMQMVHITYRLLTAILRIVKPTDNFNDITQKVQMVPVPSGQRGH